MGDVLSFHPTVQYLNKRADPDTIANLRLHHLQRVHAYRNVVSHQQHIISCGCCGVSRIDDPLSFSFSLPLSETSNAKSSKKKSSIPVEFFNIRTDLSILRLESFDLNTFVSGLPEIAVSEWNFDIHVQLMTSDYTLYTETFLKSFDQHLYLGNTMQSVQYRSCFHYRSVFVDIKRTIDRSKSQVATSFSDDDDDEYIIPTTSYKYSADAYFLIPCMVQFQFNGILYTHEHINTVQVPDRVYKSVPFVSLSPKCQETIFKKLEKPKYSIANGFMDFGNYEDISDVYGLFREHMHKINSCFYRFTKLEPLSLFEQIIIGAVIVFGNIMKFVAPSDYGLSGHTAHTFQIKGHIFSIANQALDTKKFMELNSKEYLEVQQLLNSLQVICLKLLK
jgi:hypothetical protein